MALREILLDGGAGQPQVRVFFGQAQYGEYRVSLKCGASGKRVVQGEGDNADTTDDQFPLKTPLSKLDGCVLSWWLTIAAPASGQGQRYYARIEMIQDGKVVDTLDYGDAFANTKNIIDAVRLRVQGA